MRKSTLPSLSTRRLVLPRPSAGNLVSCLVAACLGAIAHPAAADPAMPPSSQDFDFKPPFVVYAPSPGKTPAGKQKRPRAPMPGYCTNMPRPVTALATNTRYSDGDFTRSIVDPDKDAVSRAALGPLRTEEHT